MSLESLTANEFAKHIEDIVYRHKLNHIDAVKYWADKNDVPIEECVPLINSRLKAKLRLNYEELHYLPKSAKLPV